MLTLNDGRKELYQWDSGRTATVDIECDVVHFANLKYGESLAVEVKAGEVSIPNKLLTSCAPIYCWAFVADVNGNYTKQEQTLNVNKRAKPSDYVYTETEILTWKSLDERITELEKGGTGGSGGSGDGDMQKSVYDPMGKATDVFAYAENTAESKVSAHNTESGSHSDIRELITGLSNRLNALADSDDTTLDQLSEIVAYIKSNKSLIDAITTEKVSVSDIIDNLTTNNANKPLSAAQGVALKALIDGITIPEKLPNPNALTFTGAVTGSYDGSSPLSVEIPSGGGETEREWTLLGDIDISTMGGGNIELSGLDNFTEFYVTWYNVVNQSTTSSGYNAEINEILTTIHAVLIEKDGNSRFGWTHARYNGLIWEVQRSGGSITKEYISLSNVNAQFPYNHPFNVGASTKFKLVAPTPQYAAVSGNIKIYGR